MKKYLFLLTPLLLLPMAVRAQSEPDCMADPQDVTEYFGFEECSPLVVDGQIQTPTLQSIEAGWQCVQRNLPRYDTHQAWRQECMQCHNPGGCANSPGGYSGGGTASTYYTNNPGTSGGSSGTYYPAINNLSNTIFGTLTSPSVTTYSGNYQSSYTSVTQNNLSNTVILQNRIKDLIALTGAIAQYAGTTVNLPGSTTTVTVDILELNVRTAPNTAATIVSSLHKGDVVKVTGTVVGEIVHNEGTWYVTESGHYIWAGGVTSN